MAGLIFFQEQRVAESGWVSMEEAGGVRAVPWVSSTIYQSPITLPLRGSCDADGVRAAFVTGGGDGVDAVEGGGTGGGEAG